MKGRERLRSGKDLGPANEQNRGPTAGLVSSGDDLMSSHRPHLTRFGWILRVGRDSGLRFRGSDSAEEVMLELCLSSESKPGWRTPVTASPTPMPVLDLAVCSQERQTRVKFVNDSA